MGPSPWASEPWVSEPWVLVLDAWPREPWGADFRPQTSDLRRQASDPQEQPLVDPQFMHL